MNTPRLSIAFVLILIGLVSCKPADDKKQIIESDAVESSVAKKLEPIKKEIEAIEKSSDPILDESKDKMTESKQVVEEQVKKPEPPKVIKDRIVEKTTTSSTTTTPSQTSTQKPEIKEPVKTGGKTIVRPEPKSAAAEKMETVVPKETKETKEVKEEKKDITKPAMKPIDHGVFHKLLQGNVSSKGKVNYAGIKSAEATLDGYLAALSNTKVSELSKSAQLAFWINAYNAFTLKKIVDNHPVNKITDLDGGKPWDKKWINIDGKTLSLNNIENDIIRPQFNEPRIHFAVNCAAKSCPPLLNKAWSAGNLNTFLEQQTRAFVNNAAHNQLSADKIKISKIFEWYKEDFGDLITFLNKYSDVKINPDAQIEYNDYNWNLNS